MVACSSLGGEYLATAGEEKVVRIWKKGEIGFEQIKKYTGHQKRILSIDFNSRTSLAASAASESSCYIWRVKGNQELWKLSLKLKEKPLQFRGCVFSRTNSRVLFTWMNESLRGPSHLAKWDVDSGKLLGSVCISSYTVTTGCISQKDEYIGVGDNNGSVFVFDCSDLDLTAKYIKAHDMPVTSISFSPSGGNLLSVSADCSWEILPSESSASFVPSCIKYLIVSLLLVSLFVGAAYLLLDEFDAKLLDQITLAIRYITREIAKY